MRNVWLHGKHLTEALCPSTLATLTHLIVPYIATDQLVRLVGTHCPNLNLLDLSGTELSDTGIVELYRQRLGFDLCPTNLTWSLKYLLIGGPGGKRLSAEAVSKVLVKLPNLISLGSYPYTRHGSIF